MGLDVLYGEGSLDAFTKAVPRRAAIEEADVPDGSVRVNVDWEDGSRMKLHFKGSELAFLALASEEKGLYEAMIKSMLKMYQDLGIKTFTATPNSQESRAILEKRGEWERLPTGGLRWEI